MQPSFFDSHCHFDFSAFDSDRDAVWRECARQGVRGLLVPGVTARQWPVAAQLCHKLPGLVWAAGFHPWWLPDTGIEQSRRHLLAALDDTLCVAVGECGLDKIIDTSLARQMEFLHMQLEVASECNKPVIIHCRKAHHELLPLLKKHALPQGGVIHAFSGSPELASQYWSLGFYLGIGGTITYPRARKTRNAVCQLPLEALLLETDAPDMPLSGRQGQRNSPEYLPQVAEVLAQLRGETLARVAEQTRLNAARLFGAVVSDG